MLWVALVLVLLILLLLLALWIVLARLRARDGGDGGEPPVVDPGDLIPSRLDEWSLPAHLGPRLQGTPSSVDVTTLAAGSASVDGVPAAAPARVVWVDGGDEALVHLDSLTTRITGSTLVVALDLETDQTGRAPVIVRFALGAGADPAGLLATTDDVPGGHPVLVSRWGEAVTAAAWSALLDLSAEHAGQRGGVPGRLAIDSGDLVLRARTPITLQRAASRP